jgi:hypothetical protein
MKYTYSYSDYSIHSITQKYVIHYTIKLRLINEVLNINKINLFLI